MLFISEPQFKLVLFGSVFNFPFQGLFSHRVFVLLVGIVGNKCIWVRRSPYSVFLNWVNLHFTSSYCLRGEFVCLQGDLTLLTPPQGKGG